MDTKKIAEENLFFYTLAGSHVYGMATEYSDEDYKGLFYAPKKIHTSLFKSIEQVEHFGGKKDSVVYELSKFVKLLTDQNPNIIELLWTEDNFIIQRSPLYEMLRLQRDFFLSSRVKHTFSGFAMSQLKRIKGHNRWIENPQPKRRPKEVDFVSVVWNATENKEWNKIVPFQDILAYDLGGGIFGLLHDLGSGGRWHDRHEALASLPAKELASYARTSQKGFDMVVKFNHQLYKEAVDNWKHYWEWKNNRNEKRAELEELHGYDTKHAAHLVRLFRMGVEILRGEGVKVFRPDAKELLDIRNGSLTYDQLIAYTVEMTAELEVLYKTTKLPYHVDEDKVDEIVQRLYEFAWCWDQDAELKRKKQIGYKYITTG